MHAAAIGIDVGGDIARCDMSVSLVCDLGDVVCVHETSHTSVSAYDCSSREIWVVLTIPRETLPSPDLRMYTPHAQ